jgi:hypothetical protein
MSQIQKFKTAVLNFSASGDNAAIAAVSGQIISVYKIWFTVAGAVNVTYYNGLAGTALSGAIVLSGSGSSQTLYYDGSPHFVTSPGLAFNMNLSGAVALTGMVYYLLGG